MELSIICHWKAGARRQRSEVREQKAVGSKQKAESGRQKAESRKQKAITLQRGHPRRPTHARTRPQSQSPNRRNLRPRTRWERSSGSLLEIPSRLGGLRSPTVGQSCRAGAECSRSNRSASWSRLLQSHRPAQALSGAGASKRIRAFAGPVLRAPLPPHEKKTSPPRL